MAAHARAITVTRRPPAWSTPRHHGRGAELDTFLADDTVKQTTTAGSSLKFCLVARVRGRYPVPGIRVGMRVTPGPYRDRNSKFAFDH
jgi:hypothetical protein